MEGLALVLLALCVAVCTALPPSTYTTVDGKKVQALTHSDPIVEVDYHHHQHQDRVADIPLEGKPEQADTVVLVSASHGTKDNSVIFEPEKPCPKGCLEHGKCDFTTGTCACNMGWHGSDCQKAYVCVDQCNFHGVCISDSKCLCAAQFGGDTCEIDMRCPDNCNDRGTCINGGTECKCQDGWTGETCEQRVLTLFEPRVWEKHFPGKESQGTGSKPEPRHSHIGVLYGDSTTKQVMVWGGKGASNQPLDDMWIYDMPAKLWTKKAQKGTRPGPRFDAAAVTVAPLVFVFGGYEPCDEGRAFSNDLWQWSMAEERWTRVPMVLETGLTAGPPGRAGHSLVLVDTSIFVFGGRGTNSVPLSDLWRFSTTSRKWQKLASASFGSRRFHSVASFDTSSFYVFGGMDADGLAHNAIAKYDVGLDTWSIKETQGSAPAARFKHSAIVRGSTLVVYGGSSGSGFLNDMYILDTTSLTWTNVELSGPGISSLDAASAVRIGSKMVIYGGEISSGVSEEVFTADVDSRESSRETTSGDLPQPRLLSSGNVIEDKFWIFGGQTTGSKKLDDLWDFDLVTHVWTQYTPTAMAAADSIAVYKCGAMDTVEGPSAGGVVTDEDQVAWPAARSSHATTVITGSESLCNEYPTLVMFGGVGALDAKALDDIWYWCAGSQQWTEVPVPKIADANSRPVARSSSSIVFNAGKLYVFGGMTADKARLNDMWACYLGTGQCAEIPMQGAHKPHTRRSMHLHIDSVTHQPFVFGGYWKEKNTCSLCSGAIRTFEHERTTDVWKYQPAYNRWKRLAARDTPDQRFCSGSAVSGNKLFMFGGYAVDGIVEHNDMWYLNLEASQWRRIPSTAGLPNPVGRHDHILDVWGHEGRTYAVVFGGIGISGVLHDVWVTDITDAVQASDWSPTTVPLSHTKHVVA